MAMGTVVDTLESVDEYGNQPLFPSQFEEISAAIYENDNIF